MTRILIALAALLLTSVSLAGEVGIFRNGQHNLRLHSEPCNHAGTLAHLKPEWREKFKKARAHISGQDYFACWIVQEDGTVFFILEDGDTGELPFTAFKPDGA